MRHIILSLSVVVMLLSLGSCSLIDDNFDNYETQRTIECRLHVYDGIDSLLASQVSGTDGQELLYALSTYYNGLLNPGRYNVGMDFYDATTNSLRISDSRDMQSNTATFTVDLPAGDLRCVAQTQQPLYAGRVNMPEEQNSYTLHLYPADAQVALVAKVDSSIKDVQIFVEGCASAFNAIDSTYTFSNNTDTLLYRSAASTSSRRTYAASVLPSEPTKTWSVIILATTSTNSITRTVLTIQKPLRAGDIRILHIAIGNNGAATTSDIGVGASVTLDWKKGGDYNTDI